MYEHIAIISLHTVTVLMVCYHSVAGRVARCVCVLSVTALPLDGGAATTTFDGDHSSTKAQDIKGEECSRQGQSGCVMLHEGSLSTLSFAFSTRSAPKPDVIAKVRVGDDAACIITHAYQPCPLHTDTEHSTCKSIDFALI